MFIKIGHFIKVVCASCLMLALLSACAAGVRNDVSQADNSTEATVSGEETDDRTTGTSADAETTQDNSTEATASEKETDDSTTGTSADAEVTQDSSTEDTVSEKETEKTADGDLNARKIFASTLRNLLYSNILPDGEQAELSADAYSKFAVADVDADGKEELVLLYNPGVTASELGYIIGYDTQAKDIRIELTEFPAFTFLENGNLKALSSHNQSMGEMWPYALYQYLPESDSYKLSGYVHSEDKNIFELNEVAERYPSEADKSGTGTVYYVGTDTWGTTPIDETDYLAWLKENQGNASELEIEYLSLSEENILSIEK
jgi:hypothetical protein